jgi:hypothetical protein
MATLPRAIASAILPFRPLFSHRVFEHARELLVGAILAPGRRTVASVLRILGRADDTRFIRFHRVLSRARWSAFLAAKILLRMLVSRFAPEGEVVVGLDDTIERRWGRKIAARGIYRDPVRSSKSHFVKTSGLRWLSFQLLARVPWAERIWGLPFLTILCPSERYSEERGDEHKPVLAWARQGIWQLKRWVPTRELVVVGDSSFSAIEWLDGVRAHATIVTRLRMDAALYEPAPPRRPGQRGRPRKKGRRLPPLAKKAEDGRTRWRRVTIAQWYGAQEREVEVATGTCVWYHPGKPVVPIRWVLIRDPRGEFETQALLCTKLDATPDEILGWFVRRWAMEVTFEEARAHLGIETQRQWSEKAIARTTPALLALYSLVTLMASNLAKAGKVPIRTAAWYEKERPTFSDTIALVRREIWRSRIISTSGAKGDNEKFSPTLLERFTEALCYAA